VCNCAFCVLSFVRCTPTVSTVSPNFFFFLKRGGANSVITESDFVGQGCEF
jgi:hypothetical protein